MEYKVNDKAKLKCDFIVYNPFEDYEIILHPGDICTVTHVLKNNDIRVECSVPLKDRVKIPGTNKSAFIVADNDTQMESFCIYFNIDEQKNIIEKVI